MQIPFITSHFKENHVTWSQNDLELLSPEDLF
jgi:hypothetical protein